MYPKLYPVKPLGFLNTREKNQSATCVLSIDEHHITLQRNGDSPVTIPKEEVEKITKSSSGTIVIKGKGSSIKVPPQIEKYKELENALNEIAPIHNRSLIALCQQFSLLFLILLLVLIDIVVLSTNKFLVTTSSFILLSGLSLFIYEGIWCKGMRKNPFV